VGVIDASSFDVKVDYVSGNNPNVVSIGDIDGDGKHDLATANWDSKTISVLKNTSTAGVIDAVPSMSKLIS